MPRQAPKPNAQSPLKRVHIRKQILHLLIAQNLAEAFHFAAAMQDDVSHAFVVDGKAADHHVLAPVDPFQARAFLAARGVGLVAAVAVVVINLATRALLGVQTEFSVGFATLDVASGNKERNQYRDTEAQRKEIA